MKKYILLLLAGLMHTVLFAQGIGNWKAYPAYQIATKNIPVGNKVYSLYNGNLLSYNTDDTEVVTYDKIYQLNDSKIKFIEYSAAARRLLLIYDNYNIDLLDAEDNVLNLAQYKDNTSPDKGINNVSIDGKWAYLCTNTGLITIDMQEGVFANTYELGKKVLCCAANETHIYASTPEGTYKGNKTANLQDKANWILAATFRFTDLFYLDKTFFAYVNNNGLFKVNENMYLERINSDQYTFRALQNNHLILGNNQKVVVYESADESKIIRQPNAFNYLTYNKGTFWGSCGLKGLQAYKENTSTQQLEPSMGVIQPNSPAYDYFYYMKFVGDRLLVAGGSLNYFNNNYEGAATYYENGTWTTFEYGDSITKKTGMPYINLTTIAQDPENPDRHFVSSARQGLYEFEKGKFVRNYNYRNSSLTTILPNDARPYNYVSCSGLTYDTEGNLWMLNNEVDTIFKIMKPDGKWVRLYYSEIEGAPTCDFMFFDSTGKIWVNSRRGNNRGIFCLDYNGTLEKRTDDKHILRGEIINQDGIRYSPDEFYCLTEDKNGQIWVGTNNGPFVITNPAAFFNSDFTFEQIKISRNDGSNLADYLLNNIVVNTIAIDGGNRKWIGTTGNGVYLVSDDGQEMIQHFTEENSPLISNNIYSIAVNGKTGEVMIGTDKGLVSYMSDATEPEEELEKANIYAYPNPVEPGYEGPIVVKGLTTDCEVKIVSTTGQLIFSGISNGGIFTWNGRNRQGRKVASGVYNVLASTVDGSDCVVTKIAIIK